MIFSKEIIKVLSTPEEYFTASILVTQLKNAKIQEGIFIQKYSMEEIQRFKDYWNLIRPMLNQEKILSTEYRLRWDGSTENELYEFEFDSTTEHRITIGFYKLMKEYDLYFYQQKDQPLHTHFIMGKTQNLSSSNRVKDIINLFQT